MKCGAKPWEWLSLTNKHTHFLICGSVVWAPVTARDTWGNEQHNWMHNPCYLLINKLAGLRMFSLSCVPQQWCSMFTQTGLKEGTDRRSRHFLTLEPNCLLLEKDWCAVQRSLPFNHRCSNRLHEADYYKRSSLQPSSVLLSPFHTASDQAVLIHCS